MRMIPVLALVALTLAGCNNSHRTPAPQLVGELYAADGKEGAVGNLYIVNPANGNTTIVGPIGYALTAMAFHPNGTLYGTEATQDGNFGSSRLIMINHLTGAGTPIGELIDPAGPDNHDAIAGITFVGDRLIGYSDDGDQPVEINLTNGEVTPIGGGGGAGSYGLGLAANAAGIVYFAPNSSEGDLYTIDPTTGVETQGPAMSGASIGEGIMGMTFLNGLLYGVDGGDTSTGDPINLICIDPLTGAVTDMGSLPTTVEAIAGTVP